MTPLIDVLLVLLVMFVITIPASVDSTEIDLAQPCHDCALPELSAGKNRLTIDCDDRIRWNGEAVSAEQLSELLAVSQKMSREPTLLFERRLRHSRPHHGRHQGQRCNQFRLCRQRTL